MEVTSKRFNEVTGLELPAIYTFIRGQKELESADIGGTVYMLLSLSLDIGGDEITIWILNIADQTLDTFIMAYIRYATIGLHTR